MAQEPENLKRIIVHHLGTAPAVLAITGAPRVLTAHIGDPDEASRKLPLIVAQLRGGRTAQSSTVLRATLWLWAYSGTSQSEAGQLYRAAFDVLQKSGLGAPIDPNTSGPAFPMCANFQETGSPIEGYNPDVRAYWSRGAWLAIARG